MKTTRSRLSAAWLQRAGAAAWVLISLSAAIGPSRSAWGQAIRKNEATMSREEREAFVAAAKKMKSLGTYNQFVTKHSNALAQAHRSSSFLPWHRKFMVDFEKLLLEAHAANLASYSADDPRKKVKLSGLPYWEWSQDQAKDKLPWIDTTEPVMADLFFLGGDGDAGDKGIVKSGPFITNWETVNADGTKANGDGKLRRAFGRSASAPTLPTRANIKAALSVADYDAEAKAVSGVRAAGWNEFSEESKSFRNALEGWRWNREADGAAKSRKIKVMVPDPANPGMTIEVERTIADGKAPELHNRVHVWVGGNMLIVPTAPNDPAFFLNHAEVDRIWAIWQSNSDRDRRAANNDRNYPSVGPAAGQRLNDKMGADVGDVTPKQMLDTDNILDKDNNKIASYRYEVAASGKKGQAGNWSDATGWDLNDNWLLNRAPNNDKWLVYSATLLDEGKEIKQNVAGLELLNLTNQGSNLVVQNNTKVLERIRNQKNGSIKVEAGKSLSTDLLVNDGKVLNAGSVDAKTIKNNKIVKLDPALVQITGTEPEDLFDNAATGTVSGDGSIVGNVRNDGSFDPGLLDPADFTEIGAAPINVVGDYQQGAAGELVIDISGSGQDQLAITGDGDFAGKLIVNFVPGFVPANGQPFLELVKVAGLRSGNFSPAQVTVTGLAPGFSYTAGFDGANSFNLIAGGNATPALPVLDTTADPNGQIDFGSVRIGSTAVRTFDVANAGAAGSLLKGHVSETHGEFFTDLGTDFALTAGENFAHPVAYAPVDHGGDADVVMVSSPTAQDAIPLLGSGVGPEFSSSAPLGSILDFGEIDVGDSKSLSLTLKNLTTDSPTANSLVDLTILDVFISDNSFEHFSLSGVSPGTVLGKGGEVEVDLDFFAHEMNDHVDEMDLEHHGSFDNIVSSLGVKKAVLNIVTDQNAAFGQVGDIFQFGLLATVVPTPTSLALGLIGMGLAGACRRWPAASRTLVTSRICDRAFGS